MATSGDCSETKYNTLWDIDLLDFDRKVKNLSEFKGKKLLFLTLASGNVRCGEFLNQLMQNKEELEQNNIQVIGLPTNTNGKERKTFEEQKAFYKDLNIPYFPAVRHTYKILKLTKCFRQRSKDSTPTHWSNF